MKHRRGHRGNIKKKLDKDEDDKNDKEDAALKKFRYNFRRRY